MKEIKYPYFKKDRILKIEMLENMRDFPRDVLDIYNYNLTDGIICGFKPAVDKNIITFSGGITKYDGQVYVIGEPIVLNYEETEKDVMIKISFDETVLDKDYKIMPVNAFIDENMEVTSSQQELGRFKLKKGAYLRSNYQDLYDFTTEYNTLNIVNVKYAGIGEPTINTEILKYFAGEVLRAPVENIYDISFCMQCLNSQRIEKALIYSYLSYKLDENITYMSNVDIHENLVEILNGIKQKNSRKARNKVFSSKIVLE